MSSILEVNERGAYAVIEPGVTFRDLSEYCLEHKRSVWPNVPSIGWGSVIGNVCPRLSILCPSSHIPPLTPASRDVGDVDTPRLSIEV